MSFRRVNKKQYPTGTRISTSNGQTLTSTGVASFDDMLGGGLPLGSVLLVKEDRFTKYAQLLLKYYLAQGVALGHECSLTHFDGAPEEMMNDLMGVVENKASTTVEEDDQDFVSGMVGVAGGRVMGALRKTDDRMKIAWRYQGLNTFSSAISSGTSTSLRTYCHNFDLTKRIAPKLLESIRVSLFDVQVDPDAILEHIKTQLDNPALRYMI